MFEHNPVGSEENDELLVKSDLNPLLTGKMWPYRVNTVMNAAAAKVGDETVLLCRVEDRCGLSHLSVARSHNGLTGWHIDPEPLIAPHGRAAQWGVEDPRITWVEELDAYVLAYTVVGPEGAKLALALTKDFREVEEIGAVRGPDDKNGSLLPRRVNGKFVLFSRPALKDRKPGIYLSYSDDLKVWDGPYPVMEPRRGTWWDSRRIGIAAPPIETEHGWLMFYHGVRSAVSGDIYRCGAALLDLDDPTKVTHRGLEWLLTPSEEYELSGDVPGVVFPCGTVIDGDRVRLYYGAADTCLGVAQGRLSSIVDYLLQCPADEQPIPAV